MKNFDLLLVGAGEMSINYIDVLKAQSLNFCVICRNSERANKLRSNDGFIIAEKDLELRGPGNIMGTQQSGEMPLRITNLIGDSKLIQKIRLLVEKILEKDPKLTNPNNSLILSYLKQIIDKKNIWEYIS